jgi:hypothetical protein
MPNPDVPFWLDWAYDHDYANPGTTSRYGNYLRQANGAFRDICYDDPTVAFAAAAWRIAAGSVMAPPLVRSHPRVMSVSLERSDWNGEMIADVRVISPRPQALSHAMTTGGYYYRDCNARGYPAVDGADLARDAYLLTEVRVLWQLPPGILPAIQGVPAGFEALFDRAVGCVEVLVAALNREVGLVIEQLESPLGQPPAATSQEGML